MVVVTHNRSLAARADRALLLEDGRLRETDVREVRAPDDVRQLQGARRGRAADDDRGQRRCDQLHLCEQCAAERGVETTVATPKHPLGEFLQAVQQQLPTAATRAAALHVLPADDGATSGRPGGWGCARCYATFEASMRELLRRVHGSSRHVGRALSRRRSRDCSSGRRVLGELRERLRRAIEQRAVRGGGASCATASR